jgi:endogenous inhibitor of DNA gyrase (YacG/DUF329 family)
MNCIQCGEEFTPQNSLQKYCGIKCSFDAARSERVRKRELASQGKKVCPLCGAVFSKCRGHSLYCSDECARRAHQGWSSTVGKCAECGKEFEKQSETHLYCSDSCRDAAHEIAKATAKATDKAPNNKTRHCVICGALTANWRRCDACVAEAAARAYGNDEYGEVNMGGYVA